LLENAATRACGRGSGLTAAMKIVARVLLPWRSSRRPRTRLLATRGWVAHSSVDHRIATHARCHLHDPPACYHPAVQSISRGDPARVVALRVGVLTGSRLSPTGQIHCCKVLARGAP